MKLGVTAALLCLATMSVVDGAIFSINQVTQNVQPTTAKPEFTEIVIFPLPSERKHIDKEPKDAALEQENKLLVWETIKGFACRIEKSSWSVCIQHNVTQERCQSRGCCFDDSDIERPHCFKALSRRELSRKVQEVDLITTLYGDEPGRKTDQGYMIASMLDCISTVGYYNQDQCMDDQNFIYSGIPEPPMPPGIAVVKPTKYVAPPPVDAFLQPLIGNVERTRDYFLAGLIDEEQLQLVIVISEFTPEQERRIRTAPPPTSPPVPDPETYPYVPPSRRPRPTIRVPITTDKKFPITRPSKCYWWPWGAWSNCEGYCGMGVKRRMRRCNGCIPGEGECQGNCFDYRRCASPVGNQCGYWSGWSRYSECSTSCGKGSQVRTRTCYAGSVGEPGCIGVTTQSKECHIGDGSFGGWTVWGKCSVTCDGGFSIRRQYHSCGADDKVQTRECNTRPCCGKLAWSRWSACSVTCNEGTQTRSRKDICPHIPDEVELRGCNAGPGNYGGWSDWEACSKTCPGGFQSRRRTHSCGKPDDFEARKCGQPGGYLEWTKWSPCSTTCPGGRRTRSRMHTCEDRDFDSESCGNPGFWSVWQPWSGCSSTCPGGEMVRVRFHSCTDKGDFQQAKCGKLGGYSNWGFWSACSQTCIGGKRSRSRFQVCTKERDEQVDICGNPGSWGVYSGWSTCSKPCGGGEQSRSRVHSCPSVLPGGSSNPEVEVKPCNIQPCCFFRQWESWGPCDVTCLSGRQIRRRVNICPVIKPELQRKICNAGPGFYIEWSDWSPCSKTCPGGSQFRTQKHTCGAKDKIETRFCGIDPGYGPWDKWSQCTVTCGGGSQFRRRFHICEVKGPEVQSRSCNEDPGRYLPFGPWSRCSETCPGGQRIRAAKHTCGMKDKVEVGECGGPGNYGPWTDWSPCSSTCTGEQSRQQFHECGLAPKIEKRVCGSSGSYSGWSQWGACSQTCIGGNQMRYRVHNCDMPVDSETRPCGQPPQHGPWSFWASCSVTCGTGRRIRRRRGICGAEMEFDTEICGTVPCCILLPWEAWSPCSTTCYKGEQTRTRSSKCAEKREVVDTQVRECNAGDGDYDNWGPWSPCPVTCGQSVIFRLRDHSCEPEPGRDTGLCATQPCPFWTPWESWQSCSVSCFRGTRMRTRECVNGKVGMVGCDGEPIGIESCTISMGEWSNWSAWSDCSKTCKGGFHTRRRTHSCGLDPETDTNFCNTHQGDWTAWEPWTECSVTCGGGFRTRSRGHTCGEQRDTEVVPCNTDPGSYRPWSEWSVCTRTCAGGFHTRTRSHSCGLEDEIDTDQCNTSPGFWRPWSSWTDCSVSCGGGIRTKNRGHTCGLDDEYEPERCNEIPCERWTPWSLWGDCSVTCKKGVQIRTRRCVDGDPGMKGCLGKFMENIECSFGNGAWSDWSSFTECSATCKGGEMSRFRTHDCDLDPQVEVVPCNTHEGEYGKWTRWSRCTATCGGGTHTRSRSHTCGERDQVVTEPCNTFEGEYLEWSNWSRCTTTCGDGTKTRTRRHSCNRPMEMETVKCNTKPCAYWGGWSNYGPCDASCGEGKRSRIRICIGGEPGEGLCFGLPVATEFCDAGPCCTWDWSGWSACCTSFAETNIQKRLRGNACGQEYEEITRECPPGEKPIAACTDESKIWNPVY